MGANITKYCACKKKSAIYAKKQCNTKTKSIKTVQYKTIGKPYDYHYPCPLSLWISRSHSPTVHARAEWAVLEQIPQWGGCGVVKWQIAQGVIRSSRPLPKPGLPGPTLPTSPRLLIRSFSLGLPRFLAAWGSNKVSHICLSWTRNWIPHGIEHGIEYQCNQRMRWQQNARALNSKLSVPHVHPMWRNAHFCCRRQCWEIG